MATMKWIDRVKKMPLPLVQVDVWVNEQRWPHRITDTFTDKYRKHFLKANQDGSWSRLKNVTHWMSLPPNP